MRIDKFLWCIRVYKTRSLAASQCKLEKVWLNGAEVKPSREVKLGDVLTVRKGPILFSHKALAFPRARLGAKLVPTCALDVTAPEEMAKLEMIRMQFRLERRRGLGRPTKKERRELDDYTDLDFEEEWMSGEETPDES
jgi:ribosome-associated heat shock protein Hsp15